MDGMFYDGEVNFELLVFFWEGGGRVVVMVEKINIQAPQETLNLLMSKKTSGTQTHTYLHKCMLPTA
jgi:hypothetical protein